MRKLFAYSAVALPVLIVLGILVYNLPPVHDRLSWRVHSYWVQVRRILRPPEEVIFVPQSEGTSAALLPSSTPAPTLTPTAIIPTGTAIPSPTPAPTLTPTPIPAATILTGVRHEYESRNNCGPATLSMALSFWGWQGDQRDTRAVLRPNLEVDDKNVMPAEMVLYVQENTEMQALVRVAGDLDLLKSLLAAGFPVIVEKGYDPDWEDWMGHYVLLTGYEDERARFISQDSLIMPDLPVPYEELSDSWWRHFNYLYIVIYPAEREGEVLSILGPHADPAVNFTAAAERAQAEINSLQGRDLYFAWYNLGSSLLGLGDVNGSAQAYDQAFALYPAIAEAERPWRALWYQTGPYEAYYGAGRYADVINLADATFTAIGDPILEETYFWRGKARQAAGDVEGAISDYQKAVKLNPNSTPAMEELQSLGITAP